MKEIFNNREIAIILWIGIPLLLLILLNKIFRKETIKLITSFLNIKGLLKMYLELIFYITLITLLLTFFGLWNINLLKDTIVWSIFVSFPLLMKTNKINENKNYLITILKDSIKAIVIIEFIFNFYSFSLITEMIIIPIATFIGLSEIVTKDKPEYLKIEVFFNLIQTLFGITIIAYTFYQIYNGLYGFISLSTLKSFLLPIVLTILLIPFLYFMALWILYKTMYYRLTHKVKKKKHKLYIRKKLFKTFLLNREKLRKFQLQLGFNDLKNKKDYNKVINQFNSDN